MSQWLSQLIMPLSENKVGEDPRYADEFLAVKQESEKLSNVNYTLVLEKSRHILLNKSKDLRVAVYFMTANAFLNGVDGFIEGLETVKVLLATFGAEMHPQKNEVRVNTLKWLISPRLSAYLATLTIMPGQLTALNQLLAELKNIMQQLFADQVNGVPILEQWLQSVATPASTKSAEQPVSQASVSTLSAPTVEQAILPSTTINYAKELDAAATAIIQYYQRQQNWLAAAMFSRALRWGDLQLPAHQDLRSKIPPLRSNGLSQLTALLAKNEPQQVYEQCEALFLEPGGQVNLDLQYHAYYAAITMRNEALADYIAQAVMGLNKRLPLLMELQYANGDPFAAVATRSWILELLQINNGTVATAVTAAVAELDIQQYVEQAKQHAASPRLADQLSYLQALNVHGPRDQLQKQRAIAQICMEHKRSDLAVSLLEQLADQVAWYHLETWEPDLAVAVWTNLYQALQAQQKKSTDDQKNTYLNRMHQLHLRISQVDIAKALLL